MKKLLFLLCMLFTTTAFAGNLSVDPFLVSSDVTISHLEAFRSGVINKINSLPGGNIQDGTITSTKLNANADPTYRWNEAFNDFVYTGLTFSTAAVGVVPYTAGTAYVSGWRVVKDAATIDISDASYLTKDVYIDISKNGTFAKTPVLIGASAPSAAADYTRLAKLTTGYTAGVLSVTSVTDMRTTSISTNVGEDFYIKGLELITVSPDISTVTVDAGTCRVGTTTVGKTAKTTLKFSTAADWWDGVADDYSSAAQGNAQWNYVGVKNDGSIKFLGANPPDYADTSGNTAGELKYKKTGTTYWRVIGAYRMTTANKLALHFKQNNDWVYYIKSHGYVGGAHVVNSLLKTLGGEGSTSWKTINVSHDAPAFATMVNFDGYADGAQLISFSVDGNNTPYRCFKFIAGDASGSVYNIPIESDRDLQYIVDSAHTYLYCSGYYLGDIR